MNAYNYLKQGAIVPVTINAIRDLVELGKQQADRIAELEKQLDIHFKNGFEAGKLEGWKAHKYHSTPQTKPLSDEEITAIWQTDECYQKAQAFARAILRKAQEK